MNESIDLAALTEADPAEYSSLCLVHALWYYLDQVAAIQSLGQLFICHREKALGIFHLLELLPLPDA